MVKTINIEIEQELKHQRLQITFKLHSYKVRLKFEMWRNLQNLNPMEHCKIENYNWTLRPKLNDDFRSKNILFQMALRPKL